MKIIKINFFIQYETLINQIWTFTLVAMVVLYIVCNVLPDSIVGKYLPLHNVFKPQTNVDLDYQSIGYALLHTTWATRITHSTIIVEAVLWFVVFESWHWTVPFMALALILLQSVLIGDKKFGLFFMLMGLLTFGGAVYLIQFMGISNAVLVAKSVLMLGGLMRMLSHSAELIPPLLVNKTDQFLYHNLVPFPNPVVATLNQNLVVIGHPRSQCQTAKHCGGRRDIKYSTKEAKYI